MTDDDEHRAKFEAWLLERPQIADMAHKYPPSTCYRVQGRGHYTIYSYADNQTVTLSHGADSSLPGVQVFGVPASDLEPCGCGGWEWPSVEQAEATKQRIDDAIEHRDATRKGKN